MTKATSKSGKYTVVGVCPVMGVPTGGTLDLEDAERAAQFIASGHIALTKKGESV